MKKIIACTLLVLLCSIHGQLWATKQLSFKTGKFKIVQFTDIHWNPQSTNCTKTTASIEAVIQTEKPDVAILTGDIVTAKPGIEGWKSIIAIFERAQLPFAVVMGNHDAEIMPKADIYSLLEQSSYFIGERGPKEIHGMGNYVIPIYSSDGKQPAALLYCIDSNDYPTLKEYGTYDWIHFNQINWYREKSSHYTQANGGKPLPALAFFHIPLPEYQEVVGAKTTLGRMEEGEICAPKINTGFFSSMIEMGDIMATFTGHDHVNDYIGLLFGKGLAYGRVSGWDAYGDFERGGRIIELEEGKFAFDSWIRTENKKEDVYYYPSGLTSYDERTMSYLPALQVVPQKQGVAYSYYEGPFKNTDQLNDASPRKTGSMKNFSINEATAKDHFGYLFRTWIKIPERGVYRFYTYSDDGSKLEIDGKTIVDNDGSHNAGIAKGTVALEAGYHELVLRYFEDYMGEALEVGISSRMIPEGLIPDEMLFIPNK